MHSDSLSLFLFNLNWPNVFGIICCLYTLFMSVRHSMESLARLFVVVVVVCIFFFIDVMRIKRNWKSCPLLLFRYVDYTGCTTCIWMYIVLLLVVFFKALSLKCMRRYFFTALGVHHFNRKLVRVFVRECLIFQIFIQKFIEIEKIESILVECHLTFNFNMIPIST